MWGSSRVPLTNTAAGATLGPSLGLISLIQPVLPQLRAAWKRIPEIGGEYANDPHAGIGGAVAIRVAQGWGTRRWQERSRVGVGLVEAYNLVAKGGVPTSTQQSAYCGEEAWRTLRFFRSALRADEPVMRRIIAQLLAADDLGNQEVPHCVLLLRAAVAIGAWSGNLAGEHHVALDSWAYNVGNLWGAHTASSEAAAEFQTRAIGALHRLPECEAKDIFLALTTSDVDAALAQCPGWTPHQVPSPNPPDSAIARVIDAGFSTSSSVAAAARWQLSLPGKQLRGRFVVAAAEAARDDWTNIGPAEAGGTDPGDTASSGHQIRRAAQHRRVLEAAAEIEWIHAGSLLLDDIVDAAELRRGHPPLYRFTTPAFATGTAIWMLAQVWLRRPELGEAMLTLAEGQRAELACTPVPAATMRDWYAVAGAKTAALFAAAARVGAETVGASARHGAALAKFGHEAGLAFQILDDVLDEVGNAARLGKAPGADRRAGRPSLPSILAETMPEHEVIPACHARALNHIKRAELHLANLPGNTVPLRNLARQCVERES